MIPAGYRRKLTSNERGASLVVRFGPQERLDAASLAASAGGLDAEVNPDEMDLEAAFQAAQEAYDEALHDERAARDRGDLISLGNALRRSAEATFYQLGLAERVPLAYEKSYRKAAKEQARRRDPKYAEYLHLKSTFEGTPENGTVPKPQD